MDVGLNNRNTLGAIAPEFADVVFFVESTSNEQHQHWSDYAKESMTNITPLQDDFINLIPENVRSNVKRLNDKVKDLQHTRVEWKQIMSGFGLTIGHVDKRPVCVSFSFAVINGKKVCFYYCTSQVADHKMIENWLISHFQLTHDGYSRWNHTDSSNFHNCINSLDSLDVEPRDTIYKGN